MFDIEEELKKLPDKPGVYIMRDASDTIIYVGKAISLKKRVKQYFKGHESDRGPKIARMISLIDHFEYVVVDTELEALVLECNLIKENRPRYNTMLMDDKSYPFIKVTVWEDYPRVILCRDQKHDKSRYYGPYTSVNAARSILDLLKKSYHIRNCSRQICVGDKDKPCLYNHMGQCDAPCAGLISKEEYAERIRQIMGYLDGDSKPLKRELTRKMQEASAEMAFEKAAQYRDLIQSLEQISQTQRITGSDEGNRDIIGMAHSGDEAVVQVFFIRNGKMVGREHYYLTGVEHETRADILDSFIKQYYAEIPSLPREILTSEEIPEEQLISEWLSEKAGFKVSIHSPKRGDRSGLVKLASSNALTVLEKDAERIKAEQRRTTGALSELGELLGIEPPLRIESFDISNISGFESVGSMVVYEGGSPKKSDYRKFKIKTVAGPDDYASMREVLTRRFTHGEREKQELMAEGADPKLSGSSFTKFPDLIMMDGGRGQVNIALEVFAELGLDIRVCGMVKDDNHRTRGLYYNNVEVPIDTHSECFKLITRIQDETHRFAIEYHRSLRSKTQVKSVLDDIEGIGPTRRRALMMAFESAEKIRSASVEELAAVEGMNRRAAESVYSFFHKG